eukprot:832850-Rhodomonas_salina.1
MPARCHTRTCAVSDKPMLLAQTTMQTTGRSPHERDVSLCVITCIEPPPLVPIPTALARTHSRAMHTGQLQGEV